MSSTLPASILFAALLTLGASPLSAQEDVLSELTLTGTELAWNGDVAHSEVTGPQQTAAIIPGPDLTSAALTLFATPRAFESYGAPALAPTSRNRALMIVGVAGMVVGAVVGGDEGTIIMLGSGALGLYGLYQYLR